MDLCENTLYNTWYGFSWFCNKYKYSETIPAAILEVWQTRRNLRRKGFVFEFFNHKRNCNSIKKHKFTNNVIKLGFFWRKRNYIFLAYVTPRLPMSVHNKCQSIRSSRLACYSEHIDVMYFLKGFFPSCNFPRVFSQVATSQMWKFPRATSQVFHSRSARPQPVLAAELGPPSPT